VSAVGHTTPRRSGCWPAALGVRRIRRARRSRSRASRVCGSITRSTERPSLPVTTVGAGWGGAAHRRRCRRGTVSPTVDTATVYARPHVSPLSLTVVPVTVCGVPPSTGLVRRAARARRPAQDDRWRRRLRWAEPEPAPVRVPAPARVPPRAWPAPRETQRAPPAEPRLRVRRRDRDGRVPSQRRPRRSSPPSSRCADRRARSRAHGAVSTSRREGCRACQAYDERVDT
jgi:hypothetical protein